MSNNILLHKISLKKRRYKENLNNLLDISHHEFLIIQKLVDTKINLNNLLLRQHSTAPKNIWEEKNIF